MDKPKEEEEEKVWDKTQVWDKLSNGLHPIQWSRDHCYLITDEQLLCLNVSTWVVSGRADISEDDPILSMAVDQSQDDEIVCFTAHRSSLIRVWKGHTLEPSLPLKTQHLGPIIGMTSRLDWNWFVTFAVAQDISMKIWNLKEQKCEQSLRGLKSKPTVYELLSPNLLAIGTVEGSLFIWKRGQALSEMLELKKHVSQINGLHKCRHDTLVSIGRDQVMILWDTNHWSCKKVVPTFEEIERSVLVDPVLFGVSDKSFTQDDQYLLSGSVKGNLRVWNTYQGTEVNNVAKLGSWTLEDISLSAMHNHGDQLYFVQDDLFTSKRLADGSTVSHRSLHLIDVTDMVLMNEDYLVVSTNTKNLQIYNLGASDQALSIHATPHKESILNLATDSKSKLASVGKERIIYIWELSPKKIKLSLIHTCVGHSANIRAVSLLENLILSADNDGVLKMWLLSPDQNELSAQGTAIAHEKEVTSIESSLSKQLVITASLDKAIKVWDMSTLTLKKTLTGHRRPVLCLNVLEQESLMLSGGADQVMKIWELHHFSCLRTIEGHSSQVTKCILTPQKNLVISATSDGNLYFWDRSGSKIGSFDGHEDQIWGLLRHGDKVITGGADGKIIFWEDRTEEIRVKKEEKRSKDVEENQILSNLVMSGSLKKALRLALKLNKPRLVYNILSQCYEEENLEEILKTLKRDQLDDLMRFVQQWNTNSKTYPVSQYVQKHYILENESNINSADLMKLLSYNVKHSDRLNQLNRKFAIVDAMLNS